MLGLIWELIQKYHIKKDTPYLFQEGVNECVKKIVPNSSISNTETKYVVFSLFTFFLSSWRDGKTLSAIVAYLKPGSVTIVDDYLLDTTHAVQVASKDLSIPAIIAPEDLISGNVDYYSIVTYLSYFRNYDDVLLGLSNCVVSGDGLQSAVVGKENAFVIQAADKTGKNIEVGGAIFSAKITGPVGELKPLHVQDNQDGTYTVTYTPMHPGTHQIELFHETVPLRQNPWIISAKWTEDQMYQEIKELRQAIALLTTKYTELQQLVLAPNKI